MSERGDILTLNYYADDLQPDPAGYLALQLTLVTFPWILDRLEFELNHVPSVSTTTRTFLAVILHRQGEDVTSLAPTIATANTVVESYKSAENVLWCASLLAEPSTDNVIRYVRTVYPRSTLYSGDSLYLVAKDTDGASQISGCIIINRDRTIRNPLGYDSAPPPSRHATEDREIREIDAAGRTTRALQLAAIRARRRGLAASYREFSSYLQQQHPWLLTAGRLAILRAFHHQRRQIP